MSEFARRWGKTLRESGKPAYQLIAELIAGDIRSGRLTARDRLPPLRELATDLGLNYTTVARGYAEARRRGLIDARAGRGTFIRPANARQPARRGSLLEMTMNLPPEPHDADVLDRVHEGFDFLRAQADPYALLRYQEFGGMPEDRDAAARWVRRVLPGVEAERVLVCPGIQSTLAALMAMLVGPGEVICAEAVTYPGVKAIAAQLGIRVHPLPTDDEGIDAHAFETACRELKPKALYCNPTLLNPTTVITSPARRAALADIALRFSIPIIEDDAYCMLPTAPTAPIACLAPDLTWYVTGLAKCVGAGLRVAYLVAPDVRRAKIVSSALRSTTIMAPAICASLATHWINDGTAEAMLVAIRRESIERQKLAAKLLPAGSYKTHHEAFHIWLSLPAQWNRIEFSSHLRSRGVGVVAADAFSVDGKPPEAVRICLGGNVDRAECRHALELIHDALVQSPAVASAAL